MPVKLTKTKISVIAFCFNEENKINDFISNLSFADEIIFIDNNSTDKSTTLATNLGATVIQQTTTDNIQQLDLVIDQTQNNWILVLDLNVKLPKELQNEIILITSNPITNNPFIIKQNLFFLGRKMKYSSLYYEKKFLLFDKQNLLSHKEQQSANKLTLKYFDNSVKLKNKIDYHITKSFDEYNYELSLLSNKKALTMYNSNLKPNFYDFLMKPFFYFTNQYFIKFGFIDGKEGYILAYINTFALLKTYLMLWLLHNNMK